MQNQHTQAGVLLGSATGSAVWVAQQLYAHGPSWAVIPPLLIGLASVIGASTNFLNERQRRQLAHFEHLKASAAARKWAGGFDQLGGLN